MTIFVDMVRKRLFHVLRNTAIILIVGALYGIFFYHTGIGFVCPLRFVTGWKCPGCGVTHMCVALMRLDFAAAFASHPALLCLTPLLAVVFIPYVCNYIRTGCWQMRRWQYVILWVCIVILAVYGIARNIFLLP